MGLPQAVDRRRLRIRTAGWDYWVAALVLLAAAVWIVLGARATSPPFSKLSVSSASASAQLMARILGGAANASLAVDVPHDGVVASWSYTRPIAIERFNYLVPGEGMNESAALNLESLDESGVWQTRAVINPLEVDQSGRIRGRVSGTAIATDWRLRVDGVPSGIYHLGSIKLRADESWLASRFAFDLAQLALVVALGYLLWRAIGYRRPWLMFAATCVLVAGVINVGFWASGAATMATSDTASYLHWPVSAFRQFGAGVWMQLLLHTIGAEWLAFAQINLTLAACFAGIMVVGRTLARPLLAIFASAALMVWGAPIQFAGYVMTEPTFVAGIALMGAGVARMTLRARPDGAILAAIGFAVAVAMKSVAIVFLVPLALALRFVDGGLKPRVHAGAIILGAGLAVHLAQSLEGYFRHGSFSPQAAMGIALSGLVAAELSIDDFPPDVRPLMTQSVAEAKSIAAGCPEPFQQPDEHLACAVRNYNTLAWHKLFIPLSDAGKTIPEINAMLSTAAIAAVKRNPLRYLQTTTLNYWGMWTYLTTSLHRPSSVFLRMLEVQSLTSYDPDWRLDQKFQGLQPGPWLTSYLTYLEQAKADLPARLANARERVTSVPQPISPVWSGTALMLLSLLVAALYFWPGLKGHGAALVSLLLLIHAYFLGHALFQVPLARYPAVASPLFLYCAMVVLAAGLDRLTRIRWRRSPLKT